MELLLTCVGGLALLAVAVLLMKASAGNSQKDVDQTLSSGLLCKSKGDYIQAEVYLEQALSNMEKVVNPDIARLSSCLVNLAECQEQLGKGAEAKQTRQMALDAWNYVLEQGRLDQLIDIDYACLSAHFGPSTKDFADFYERVLAFREKALPAKHSDFINTIVIYARLLRILGEKEIADQLDAKAADLRAN